MGSEIKFKEESPDIKPPYVCSVKIGGYSVDLFSEFDSFLPNLEGDETEYQGDIPGWSVVRTQENPQPTSIHFYPDTKTTFDYNQDSNTLNVRGNPDDFVDGQAFAYIGFWLTEAQRQKDSIFTLHASSFTVNGKGILLAGDGGSGKTAIALGMCRKFDCEFISNDLSVIGYDKGLDKIFILHGGKVVRLRLTTVKLNFPELINMFQDNDQSPWTTKVPVTFEQLGLKSAKGPRALDAAFTVHLDSNPNERTTLKRLTGIETQFGLYENLSRIIRGSAISIFDRNKNIVGYLPSLDSENTHNNRVNLINHLVRKRAIWHISGGDLKEICNTIYKVAQDATQN